MLTSLSQQLWHGKRPLKMYANALTKFGIVGRVAHPDAPEQKLAGVVSTFQRFTFDQKTKL